MEKRKWTLTHQIAYLYFTVGIIGQGQQDARDKRLPVIANKFSEWPFEGEDNKKILEEAVQTALSDMEDSMEPVVKKLESCVTNLKENLSKDNLGAIIDDLFHIVNSASPTDGEIEQIKAIAKHFDIESQKPEKLKKESERTSGKKRTLLHEMAYVYFDLATQNQEQSPEEIEAKLKAVKTKLAEWTEEKDTLQDLLPDTLAEICDDKREKIEEYVDRIGKCHELMKEHIPGDQLAFVIDDLIDIVNTGTPHEAEIHMLGSLAEYFGVSLEGEKYQILNRPHQTNKSETDSSESSDDAKHTLIHEIAFCYVASAIYEGVGEGVDEGGLQKRLNRVLEMLSGWSPDFADPDMDFQDLIQETISKIESEEKSEDLLDLYWQSLKWIKEQVSSKQLPRIIHDLKYILVDARSRELEALKTTAEFLDVPFENPAFKNELSKFIAERDERQSRATGALAWSSLYEEDAVPCRDNMLSFIFNPARLHALGLLETAESDDANTLKEQIIEAATERIKETGMIPVLLLGGEDEYEEEIVLQLSGKGNKKVPIKDIYESLGYPLKRAPFFFANDFIINNAFETPVVFTQDGFITLHPKKSGDWTLTTWDAWSGSQLVALNGSSEPTIRLWDEDGGAITIGSRLAKKGRPLNAAAVVIFMQAIIETFWPVVEENRDSNVLSLPMEKFDLLNEKSMKKYVMDVLRRAGSLSGAEHGDEGPEGEDKIDASPVREKLEQELESNEDDSDEDDTGVKTYEPLANKLSRPNLMTKKTEQYRAKVREDLADGKLTDIERSGLDFFQQKLGLSDEDAMRIFEEVLEELQGKTNVETSEKKKRGRPKKVADAVESSVHDADDEGGARKKRITYISWDEFEKEQSGKDELKKRWMPIAKSAHEFIRGILLENDLEYEIRYGDGTFSFYVPKDKAHSRQRKFARFGLVSFTRRHSYLDGLYVADVKDVPADAHCDTPNDDLPTYSHRFVTMDDFEQAKDIIITGVLRSYGLLATGQTTVRGGSKPLNTPENKSPDKQRKASNLAAQATLLANQDNWDEAESLFSEAIELDPSYALAYKYRGIARWNQNETSGALADCNKYLELRPGDAEAYRMRGRIKGKMGKHAEAIEDFTRAIEHGDNDGNLSISFYLRGYAQFTLKKYKGAIQDFDEAIKLDPKYEYAYYSRGLCKRHIDDKAGALIDLKKSASLGCDEAKEMLAKLQ